MSYRSRRSIRSFRRDRSGATTALFALSVLPAAVLGVPSLDLDLDLTPVWQARATVEHVLSRPNLEASLPLARRCAVPEQRCTTTTQCRGHWCTPVTSCWPTPTSCPR